MGLINSDIPELEGTNTEITLSNLDDIESELERLLERRISHVCELSDAIIMDGEDEDIIKSIILSIRYDAEKCTDRVSPDNLDDIKSLYAGISLAERLMIFRRVFSRLYTSKRPYFKCYLESFGKNSDSGIGKIAYINNAYNDAAYIAFSDSINSPTAHYANSVSEICECVREGRCEFCILPIETSNEGKLLSFYRTILKYGLKIDIVYDMVNKSGEEFTRYALLSSAIFSSVTHRGRNKERYFDFLISCCEGLSISEIAMAAQLCGLDIHSIDTMNLNFEGDSVEKYFCISLKANRGDLNTFLSYLAVDCPDFIPLGLYNKI